MAPRAASTGEACHRSSAAARGSRVRFAANSGDAHPNGDVGHVDVINEIHVNYVCNRSITFDFDPWSHDRRVEWLALPSRPWPPPRARRRRQRRRRGLDEQQPLCGVGRGTRRRSNAACSGAIQSAAVASAPRCTTTSSPASRPRTSTAATRESRCRTTCPSPCTSAADSGEVASYSEVGRKFDRYWDVIWLERPM